MACYGLLFLTLSLTLALDLADAFECTPFDYTWNSRAMDLAAQKAQGANETVIIPGYGPVSGFKDGKYVTGGKCFDRPKFVLVAAGLAILTDMLILCIPVYMVRNTSRCVSAQRSQLSPAGYLLPPRSKAPVLNPFRSTISR